MVRPPRQVGEVTVNCASYPAVTIMLAIRCRGLSYLVHPDRDGDLISWQQSYITLTSSGSLRRRVLADVSFAWSKGGPFMHKGTHVTPPFTFRMGL